ncbi:MAG: hypothetical protein EOO32_04450 [Comamonadaceae bacterium]|nr:MAG: hypothetical protein EOO32_04450 [Comamonadaceae bacterium]
MATALLTISSLSQPVRAITRWFSRGVSATKAHVRALDIQTRRPVAAPLAARQESRAIPGDIAGTRSATGAAVPSRWDDTPAANGDRFDDFNASVQAPHSAPSVSARTVRVLHRTDAAGPMRLVISGRMADVCAELDRLVAREAAHT